MFKTAQEVLELMKRANTSIRCWKCLRLTQDESHECFQEAKRFVVKFEGDLRGSVGEMWSAYPMSQEEVDRLIEEKEGNL